MDNLAVEIMLAYMISNANNAYRLLAQEVPYRSDRNAYFKNQNVLHLSNGD